MIERDPEERGEEPEADRTRDLREDDGSAQPYGESDEAPRADARGEGGEGDKEDELVTPSGIDPEPIRPQSYDLSHVPKVDAMGHDKRRTVVGQSYGPSKTRQATVWLGSVAVLLALFIGATIAVNELDNPPAQDPDTAPWRDTDVPPARPL